MKIKNKNKYQWLELITDIANECQMSARQVIALEGVLREHLGESQGLEVVDDFDHLNRRWVAIIDERA
jgi:hypothetical protein